jgi:hypothetical protein
MALTSPTSGGHSVDIVRSRNNAKELLLQIIYTFQYKHVLKNQKIIAFICKNLFRLPLATSKAQSA